MSKDLKDYIAFLVGIGKTYLYNDINIDENVRMSKIQQLKLTGLFMIENYNIMQSTIIDTALMLPVANYCLIPESENSQIAMQNISDFFLEKYSQNIHDIISDYLKEATL
jgi:hypothetical protein